MVFEESSSLFTKNKENMSRLNTLPMGSITPQQSQHLDIHIWWSFARTSDISMDMQVAAQANNLTDKVMQGLYYEKRKEMDDSTIAFQYLSSLRWVLLHSTLNSSLQDRSDKSQGEQSVFPPGLFQLLASFTLLDPFKVHFHFRNSLS